MDAPEAVNYIWIKLYKQEYVFHSLWIGKKHSTLYCQYAIYSWQSFEIKADEIDKMKLGSILMSDLPVWGNIIAH